MGNISMPDHRVALDKTWELWKVQHGRRYESSAEEMYRREVFNNNKREIEKHNRLYREGKESYSQVTNHLSDLTHQEFLNSLGNFKSFENNTEVEAMSFDATVAIPAKVDWRDEGAVLPIKNQGHCGSCWAFAAVATLEGAHKISTGELTDLSEQQLVDCSYRYGNQGCEGGWPLKALQYVRDNQGLNTEESYPYMTKMGYCHYNRKYVGSLIKQIYRTQTGSEDSLAMCLAMYGPVAVAVDATEMMSYSGGIYNNIRCNPHNLNHAVTVVGYTTDSWIIKNSWSTHWGGAGVHEAGQEQGQHVWGGHGRGLPHCLTINNCLVLLLNIQ